MKRSLVVAFLLVALWLPGTRVDACEPPAPDPWFIAELNVNTLALPEAVTLDVGKPSAEPRLVVGNDSDIPVEVADRILVSGDRLELSGPELEDVLGISIVHKRADDRPPFVRPPAGRQFLVVMHRQGQRLLLPGTVTYRLNPAYDPRRQADGVAACKRRNGLWIGVGLVVLVGFAVALVVRTVRESRS